MTSKPYIIANAAGFWGDQIDAPRRLVEAARVDVLTLEYLAELTMSILARGRQKDATRGYAMDVVDVVRSLCPALQSQPQLKVVTNAGGVNPQACAVAVARVLVEAGQGGAVVAVISGDEVTQRITELQAKGCEFVNLDTGQPLSELNHPVVAANAYLGAHPISEAIAEGARFVITGRVADASLTVGPAAAHFGWKWDDWNRLAGTTVAGHLIECGAQVTGGYSTEWANVPNLAEVGYPIAEVADDGSCVITKPKDSGGEVNRRTVVEQLVYEIGDPAAYLTPDVVADFTSVHVDDLGDDRVAVSTALGKPATDTYKVSMAYEDGFTASAQLLVKGGDAVEKADACAKMVFHRLASAGCLPRQREVELLGCDHQQEAGSEVVLRLAVHDAELNKVERFAREIAPLITSGPAGLAGYAVGRPMVRPVHAYWPTLIPKTMLKPRLEMRTADQWLRKTGER